MEKDESKPRCDHKCHHPDCGLNPWIEFCPICECANVNYDAEAVMPQWMKDWFTR